MNDAPSSDDTPTEGMDSPDYALRLVRLLRLAEELDWARRLGRGERLLLPLAEMPASFRYLLRLTSGLPEESPGSALHRFASVFASELELVRQARNRAVHAVSLDDEALDLALEVAERLVALLREIDTPHVVQPGITREAYAALQKAASAAKWDQDEVVRLLNLALTQPSTSRLSARAETVDYWLELHRRRSNLASSDAAQD
jgi:hypothetical protein